jgi:hypothetical protein
MNTDIRLLRGKESGIGRAASAAELLEMMRPPIGQHCPTQKPTPPKGFGGQRAASSGPAAARLGQPLDIGEVARLLGCSPWSIRNTWIPRGLPHFRSGASSRLIFFEVQVVRWIENQQSKGG